MGVCSDIQNRMTACFQKEVSDQRTLNINLRISFYYFLMVFCEKLKDRRVQGVKSNHSIDHYIKKDPKLAEKIKILEELRAKKEAESK